MNRSFAKRSWDGIVEFSDVWISNLVRLQSFTFHLHHQYFAFAAFFHANRARWKFGFISTLLEVIFLSIFFLPFFCSSWESSFRFFGLSPLKTHIFSISNTLLIMVRHSFIENSSSFQVKSSCLEAEHSGDTETRIDQKFLVPSNQKQLFRHQPS
jgi:hypothetical protein